MKKKNFWFFCQNWGWPVIFDQNSNLSRPVVLKGFEIQSQQRTAHYLWRFWNGGLTYDAMGQIDPSLIIGIGLKHRYLLNYVLRGLFVCNWHNILTSRRAPNKEAMPINNANQSSIVLGGTRTFPNSLFFI